MECDDAADPPIRGHIRQVGFRRVAHGLFLVDRADADPPTEFRRDLRAWRLVLPPSAAFTHLTAARLYGWQVPPRLPEQVPVFAAVDQGDRRPRRPGLLCSRLRRTRKPGLIDGLPVEPAEEVLLRAARDLGPLDLLVLVDSARRHGDVDPTEMRTLLQSRRPGVRNLAQAWARSTPHAQSAGETLLRAFDRSQDVEVQPQVELHDASGNLVGTVDLLVVGTRLVHEYDGSHHRAGAQHRTDLRRDRALAAANYQRRGFTLDDLVRNAAVTIHELDRDLGRAHDLRRVERWRHLVGNSMVSEVGRRRIMNRWQRQMGVADWARAG